MVSSLLKPASNLYDIIRYLVISRFVLTSGKIAINVQYNCIAINVTRTIFSLGSHVFHLSINIRYIMYYPTLIRTNQMIHGLTLNFECVTFLMLSYIFMHLV